MASLAEAKTLSPSMATPTDAPSKSGKHSVEYRALRKHYRKLVKVVSQHRIAAALFENEVIEDDMLELFTTSLTGTDIGGKIMTNVLLSIKLQPEKHFESFCKSLEVEDSLKDVLKELKSELYIIFSIFNLNAVLNFTYIQVPMPSLLKNRLLFVSQIVSTLYNM